MERESNPMQALCRSGCGFYGNPATDGLCSLCFKEALKKKQQPPVSAPSSAAAVPVPAAITQQQQQAAVAAAAAASSLASLIDTATAQPTVPPCVATAAVSAGGCGAEAAKEMGCDESGSSLADQEDDEGKEEDEGKDGDEGKKKKNRCATCRKKVGLTGFLCRCGGLYCAVHRYSDKHECSFDYREMGAQEIRRNNPVVVGEKIQKI